MLARRKPEEMIPCFTSLDGIPSSFGPSVAAIGNFDGVHLGHREILSAIAADARKLGARAVAVTFDPHPEAFLRPESAPKLLTPLRDRIRLLGEAGADAVLVLPFTPELAALSAQDFVQKILIDGLNVKALHQGFNFRYGYKAEAGVEELAAMGTAMGFSLTVHQPIHIRGLEVSSSAIRERVAAGDLIRARWLLGRPFYVSSTQARGRGIGTRLLVPTVNLANYEGLLPSFGVYVTRLVVGERRFQAVTNVGNRPTFGEASFAVESHILDFEPIEITPETPLRLEFLYRLRGEETWPTPKALKAQIMKDVGRAQRYFRLVS